MNKFTIEYRGEVKINSFINGIYSNTQIFHNNGTNVLFTYLCRALATDRIDSSWVSTLSKNRPDQLVLRGDRGEETPKWEDVSITPILIYSAVQESPDPSDASSVPSVTFNALLSSRNVRRNTKYKSFCLSMQTEGGIELANVILSSGDASEPYEIAEDEIQQIQWTMSFVNVTKSEQTEGGND